MKYSNGEFIDDVWLDVFIVVRCSYNHVLQGTRWILDKFSVSLVKESVGKKRLNGMAILLTASAYPIELIGSKRDSVRT